jgi:hypothetical protein
VADDFFKLLFLGLAVAVSPIPILALSLVLLTPRRRTNGLAFLIGWVGGLALVSLVAYFLSGLLQSAIGAEAADWTLFIRLAAGVAFILFAFKSWRDGQKRENTSDLPVLAAHVDDMGPAESLGMAGFLGVVGVKNPLLCLAAVSVIVASGLEPPGALLGWLLFLAAASTTIAIPVFYARWGGEGVARNLDRMRAWVQANGYNLIAITFLTMGVLFVRSALTELIDAGVIG